MSKIRCPYCHKRIRHATSVNGHELYWCENYDCDASSEMIGTEYMWAALADTHKRFELANGELNYIQKQLDRDKNLAKVEDLRKKLKIAYEALKRIGANYPRMTDLYRMKLANDAIEQLTKGETDDKK